MRKIAICFFLINLFSLFANAAFQNPNSTLPGDKASGMGGASTAVIGDVSSSAFYNPALLSMAQGDSFSAAVGVYKKFDTLYGDSADYTKTPLRINTGFFRSLPASTGNVVDYNGWKVGMTIIVPDYEHFKGDLANTSSQTTTLTYTDESLWVGGAVSKRLDESSSWGLTIYYTARNFVRSLQDKTYNGVDSHIFTSDTSLTQNSIVPILGYYKMMSSQLGMGFSLRLPAIPFAATAAYFEDEVDTADPSNNDKINENSLGAPIFIPMTLRAGISWATLETWNFAADIQYQEGKSFDLFGLNSRSDFLDYRPLWNLNLGVEKIFTPSLQLRLGVFSNSSAHPSPLVSRGRLQGDLVNQAGFSANIHYISNSKIGYTFGGYYTGGQGTSVIRSNHQLVETTKSTHVFTMLVGTSFYF